MPHIPGHNRPFTSFLTQGMQNTNQNLNTMSMPNNQINFPKYPNPSNLPVQQDFIGTGNMKPIEEPSLGNQIDFPNYLQEQPQDPIDYGSLSDMYAAKPYMQGTINDMFEWQYDELTGEWSQQYIGDPSNLEDAQIGGIDLGGLNMGFDPSLGGMTENIGQNFDLMEFYEMIEQLEPTELSLGGLNLGGAFDTGFGNLTSNIASQLATGAAPEFTGGGGQGGQQARQLYYPGTSGGFAGVGSGIKPGSFQDLLSRR